jgi:hypothetical protein
MGLTHLVPGSLVAPPSARGRLGLTALGGRVLERWRSTGWPVAHASAPPAIAVDQEQARIFARTLARRRQPRRNLDDAALRRIATAVGWSASSSDAAPRKPSPGGSGGPHRARSPGRRRGGGVPRRGRRPAAASQDAT